MDLSMVVNFTIKMYSIFNQRPLSLHDIKFGAAATLHTEKQFDIACQLGLVPISHPQFEPDVMSF